VLYVLTLKISLNDAQKAWIFRLYLERGELTVLCKSHLKQFARIGDGVYHELVNISGQAADYAPPVFDLPDPLAKPKKSKRAPNKKSDESLAELKKFFKEKTHPLPDKAPIRIFFADIPSYRKLYKEYKKDHLKGSAHYFSWACWNYYRRSRFPWVKVSLTAASSSFLILRNSRRRRPRAILAVNSGWCRIATGNGKAILLISRPLKLWPPFVVRCSLSALCCV
jgi:hypothetical protein